MYCLCFSTLCPTCSFHRRSLTRLFKDASRVTATAYDGHEQVTTKYAATAPSVIAETEAAGATIMFHVDGTNLHNHPVLKEKQFHRIVFNSPHTGTNYVGSKKSSHESIDSNQKLLRGFFKSAVQQLRENDADCKADLSTSPSSNDVSDPQCLGRSEIHVTLKTCIPYDQFKVVDQAEHAGLSLVDFIPFDAFLYPGM